MANQVTFLNNKLYDYLLDISVAADSDIDYGNKLTDEEVGIAMQSSLEQLNFYTWLVTTLNAKKILEIGTYTGLSALAMAKGMTEGKIITLDRSHQFTGLAQQLWERANKSAFIDLRLGDAKESCQALLEHEEHHSFDLVFIDASKQDYAEYFEFSMQLLRIGGVVMIDNILMQGNILEQDSDKLSVRAVRAFNEALKNDSRVKITTLPIGDGLTLATRI